MTVVCDTETKARINGIQAQMKEFLTSSEFFSVS